MARWVAGAKWAAGPAPDDQRDTPLVLSLSEGLGRTLDSLECELSIEVAPKLKRRLGYLKRIVFRRPGDDLVLSKERDGFLHALYVRDDHPVLSCQVRLAPGSYPLDLAVFARVAEVGTDAKCFMLIDKRIDLPLCYLLGVLMSNPIGQMVAMYEERCDVVLVVFRVLVNVRRTSVDATHALEIAFSAVKVEHGAFVWPNVRAKRAPTAGRQARAGENVPRTTGPGLVACRWRSA